MTNESAMTILDPPHPTAAVLAARLRERIERRTARVGIVGLGYVGLPLALAFGERGFPVLGFDVDPDKIERLGRGESYIQHLPSERIGEAKAGGRFDATSDFGRLAETDAIVICVPTPLTGQREPDLSFVEGTARVIRRSLRRGQLVVLASTTYPGTTDELVRDLLEESGLHSGEDFFLAFAPEREDPGNTRFGTTTIPKVVGGVDPLSGDLAEALYAGVVATTVRVSSARVAEATKLMENIFRAVNIALVNELKVIYDRMGIDIWEVLDAAETKPFGFMRFDPGPGWGGHCIPLDPFYLAWKARGHGIDARFIELAGIVNVEMPKYVIDKLQTALNARGRPLEGARILVLGLSYKRDIGDPRESPAFELMGLLCQAGAEVAYHDPYVPVSPLTRRWPQLAEMRSRELTAEEVGRYDAVLLVTDHQAVDYDLVERHARLIVDTRNKARGDAARVVRA